MRPLRRGLVPHSALITTARACVIGATVVAGGCASQQAANRPATQVAVAAPQPQGMRVEIEDDGLPSQLAPRVRRQVPDDPREPWSPNYGTVVPRHADGGTTVPIEPAPQTLVMPTRVSSVDADEIMRRAIAEHEMRRRD